MPVPSRNILESRAYRYFDDEQEEFRRSAGALLPVRVLDCDLAIAVGEDIAALNLHMSTVRPGGREHPLGGAPISSNEVLRIIPPGIRKGCKDLLNSTADISLTCKDRPLHVRTTAGLEHAVLRHHRQDRIRVMPVPGCRKVIKDRNGNSVCHQVSPPGS